MSAWTCRQLSERSPKRSFHLVFESHDGTAYVPIPERSTSLRVTSTPPVVDSQKRLTPNGRLEKRTLELSRAMSALCQKQTYAAQQKNAYSITSSARASNVGGMTPSTLAVVRLMTRSNFAGDSTGMSAGVAPRRILSTYSAARRNSSRMFTPKDISASILSASLPHAAPCIAQVSTCARRKSRDSPRDRHSQRSARGWWRLAPCRL